LKVIPGSQNKKLKVDEIQLMTQNTIPFICDVPVGGTHLMKPLLLHASSKATSQRHRRVLHLEFNSTELPNGLMWAERLVIY
jgi:arylamine N-acetyltransferase